MNVAICVIYAEENCFCQNVVSDEEDWMSSSSGKLFQQSQQ